MKSLAFFQLSGMLIALVFAAQPTLYGQCTYNQITHFSGTEQVGCTEVTVTSEGAAGNGGICGYGPYWVGFDADGSYTFSFSPAISGARISISVINDMPNFAVEELSVEVNGAPYPVSIPGTDDGCRLPCVITGAGNVRCGPGDLGQGGSWADIGIIENMTSLKIINTWLFGNPNGFFMRVEICCEQCPVDAGEITASPLELCTNEQAVLPDASGILLEADDLLQYILFSNLNDTLGSIVATNSSPVFSFNPANMQTATTYYVAAMAGNSLGGNVNTNDPCLDFSNAIAVIWAPLPTVVFSAADPTICAGECTDVTAVFTGSTPFTLTINIPGIGESTQVFQANTSTFQVCLPEDAPPGIFQIQATALTDTNCTCN